MSALDPSTLKAIAAIERERRDALKERRCARVNRLYGHWGRYDLLVKTLTRLIRELKSPKKAARK